MIQFVVALLFVGFFGNIAAQPAIPPWPNSPFYTDISNAPLDPNSDAIIASLKANSNNGGGVGSNLAWGTKTGNLQMDTGQYPIWLKAGMARQCLTITGAAATLNAAQSGCTDLTGGGVMFPVPANGQWAIEAQGIGVGSCSGDCHFLVYDVPNQLIYEAYQASISGNSLTASCVVIWDLTINYPNNLLGDQCTSCDAAGFPLAPLLATADEVASGKISHAMRWIMPNAMMQTGVYVHPASHGTTATSATSPSIRYGTRIRLKSSFVNSNFPNSEGSNVTAQNVFFQAMKTYGLIVADGGGIPLLVAGDLFSVNKWANMNIDTHSFFGLGVDSFEVVQSLDPTGGPSNNGLYPTRTGNPLTYNCQPNYPSPPARAISATCSSNPNTSPTTSSPSTSTSAASASTSHSPTTKINSASGNPKQSLTLFVFSILVISISSFCFM